MLERKMEIYVFMKPFYFPTPFAFKILTPNREIQQGWLETMAAL